ncbi:CASP-like protein 4A4 [Typha latifolia]|uniref:CASP-like protein 4A4 n=1 Tax=Typha latifolia TaxID=4733 RepID=UPI003C2C1CEB
MAAANTNIVVTPIALSLSPPGNQTPHHFHHYLSPLGVTPSPFANSVASTNSRSSRLAILRRSNLLRALAFLLSFASALSLAAPPPHAAEGPQAAFNFQDHPEFRYGLSAVIVTSIYSALQLFKSIWDIAFKGVILPEKISDYITFFLDQVVAYLLISSSSISMLATVKIPPQRYRAAAIVSIIASLAAFLAIAASAIISGYKLCKRIIW